MKPARSIISAARGKPLLVRYDLEAAKPDADPRQPARARSRACGNGASCCRNDGEPVSLGEPETPIVVAAQDAAAAPQPAGQGRGPASDRLVQGARPGDGGDHGQAVRDRADRHADQRQCRRGARRLRRAGRDRDDRHLPGRNARDQRHRDRGLRRAGLCRRRADRRMRRAGREGRGAGAVVRLLDAQGAVPPRGQEGDGLRACRAARLGAARRDLLPDRRRHRPDRHVEGVRRARGGGADRAEAAAHVCGPGRRLRADRARVRAAATNSPSAGRMRRRSRPAFACPRRSAIS